MIVITVEVWPGGNKNGARQIARGVIVNITDLEKDDREVGDYEAVFEVNPYPQLKLPYKEMRGTVKNFSAEAWRVGTDSRTARNLRWV